MKNSSECEVSMRSGIGEVVDPTKGLILQKGCVNGRWHMDRQKASRARLGGVEGNCAPIFPGCDLDACCSGLCHPAV